MSMTTGKQPCPPIAGYFLVFAALLSAWSAGAERCVAAIYFGGSGTISRADLDGSNVTDLIEEFAYGIAVDSTHGHLYWARPGGHYDPNYIGRVNLDGTGKTVLIDLSEGYGDFPTSIALDLANGHMYWTAQRYGQIKRANLDGTGVTHLVSDWWLTHGPDGLSLDLINGQMYWIDAGIDVLRRANLDGTEVTNIVTGLNVANWGSTALDLANEHLYWSVDGRGIQRANLDGSNVTDIFTGPVTQIALDLPNQHIYWTEDGRNSRIRRANLDGAGIVDVIPSLGQYYNPHAIALDTTALDTTVIPEPSSGLIFAGLFGIAFFGCRYRSRQRARAT
jgi:hypothetical protein